MSGKEYVTVYDGEEAVGMVKFNRNLTSDLMAQDPELETKGITKLTDGRYVLIYGPGPYDSVPARAEIISEEMAIKEILESNNFRLLKKFDLKDKLILEEV